MRLVAHRAGARVGDEATTRGDFPQLHRTVLPRAEDVLCGGGGGGLREAQVGEVVITCQEFVSEEQQQL